MQQPTSQKARIFNPKSSKIMKKIGVLILTAACLALAPATSTFAQKVQTFGKSFKVKETKTPAEVAAALESKSPIENVTVRGEVTSVCQAAGCWIKMKNESGQDVFIKFKGESFNFPKDAAGRTAIVYGTATKKLTSVEQLRHFAEDAGKSESEIAAITEPKEEIRIDATGAQLL